MTGEPQDPTERGDFDTVLAGLRAAGESTRLRILAVLAEGELTVSELCRVLGQTQPRVSRHLRLLCDAGLLVRHTEGTSAFYAHHHRGPGRALLDRLLSLFDHDDRTLLADRQRLASIRAERASLAGEYFEQIADRWDQIRSLHVDDAEVEAALISAVDEHLADGPAAGHPRHLLDIGTGTGRILELLADRVDVGLGLDLSTGMLNVARSNLVGRGIHHCTVRHGSAHALDVSPASQDVAVLHHVLHFLDDPAAALAEAASTLRPGGLLVVVDFAPHHLEVLRTEHNHRRLGFTDAELETWSRRAGLTEVSARHLVPTGPAAGEQLTVTLWTAIQPLPLSDDLPPTTAAPDHPEPHHPDLHQADSLSSTGAGRSR